MTAQLDGKSVVIVGGANGIGRACVELFAANGARVVFGDLDIAAGEATAGGLERAGRIVAFKECDARSIDGVRGLVAYATARHGAPDVGLYAAGVIRPTDFMELTEDGFDFVMDVNLKGAVFFFQSVAAALIAAKKPGSLIGISSIGGVVATDSTHAYGMSKAGLIHLAKSMAVSLAPYGIRANTVGPGGVNTAMQARVSAADRLASLSRTPLLRLAEPREIANVALFLASEASSYVTGQTIYADGGRLALHRTVKLPEGLAVAPVQAAEG